MQRAYNWERLLDGQPHELSEGRQILDVGKFRVAAYAYGKRHGITIITRTREPGIIIIQALAGLPRRAGAREPGGRLLEAAATQEGQFPDAVAAQEGQPPARRLSQLVTAVHQVQKVLELAVPAGAASDQAYAALIAELLPRIIDDSYDDDLPDTV